MAYRLQERESTDSPTPLPALEAPHCSLSISQITSTTSRLSLDPNSLGLAEIMMGPAGECFPAACLGLAVQQRGLRNHHAHHSMIFMVFRP